MSIEAVAPIFERINSKGTPLTIVDLMRAATWSEEFDLFESITTITGALDEKDYGGIEKKTILRSISAAAGGGFSESSIDSLRKHTSDRLIRAVSDTRAAYERTVDFLATDLNILSDRQLPYVNQVVVLGEVFRLLKNPNLEQRAEIRRWFWRTAVSGYFGGWNTGNMAADQQAAQKFATGATSSLEFTGTPPSPSIWTSREFRSNAAHSKILIMLLAFGRPVDLLTAQKIDVFKALYHGNSREYHHFFPRDYLRTKKKIDSRKANVLANIVMLTSSSNKVITNRAPSDYLTDVEASLGSALREALMSNLISHEAFQAAITDDYAGFLDARAATISAKVNELTGW